IRRLMKIAYPVRLPDTSTETVSPELQRCLRRIFSLERHSRNTMAPFVTIARSGTRLDRCSRSRRVPLRAIVTNGAIVLREWRSREKILRRHRCNSGLTVSVEVSGSRTGYAIFISRRIGEPEDYVVQIRTDPGDVVKGESLIDDGIDADMPSARRIGGEVPYILNRAEGRHRHLGQEDRKGGVGPQALGTQNQGIHSPSLLLRK